MSKATLDAATRTIQVQNFDFQYSESDFANAESYDFSNRCWTGRNPKAWVIHNCGAVLAIVFAEYYSYSDQDALDEAADCGKLDSLQVSETELPDYQTGTDSEGFPEYEGIVTLGNASEPFDSQNLEYFTVPATLFESDPLIAAIIADNPQD